MAENDDVDQKDTQQSAPTQSGAVSNSPQPPLQTKPSEAQAHPSQAKPGQVKIGKQINATLSVQKEKQYSKQSEEKYGLNALRDKSANFDTKAAQAGAKTLNDRSIKRPQSRSRLSSVLRTGVAMAGLVASGGVTEPTQAQQPRTQQPAASDQLRPHKDIPQAGVNAPAQTQAPPTSQQEQPAAQPEEKEEESKLSQFAAQAAAIANKALQDKHLDAEIKQITKQASEAINAELLEGATAVWASCYLYFPLILGALVGDFVWGFKDSIIRRGLAPFLRTEALKKKGDQIAKQIKLNAAVKANVVAFNLLTVLVPVLLILLIIVMGCNDPAYSRVIAAITETGKIAKIQGAVTGNSDFCKPFEIAGLVTGGGSNGAVLGASTSTLPAACQASGSGPASQQSLANSCFGATAAQAAAVAEQVSGGIPTKAGDNVCADSKPVDIGLFQIDISRQQLAGLNCPAAFSKPYNPRKPDCAVINEPLYQQCVAAAEDSQINIQTACAISKQGTDWSAWPNAPVCNP